METLEGMSRTHHCGKISKDDTGKEVVVCGWVSRRRDHGGLIFVDLRDRSGLVQTVFAEDKMGEQLSIPIPGSPFTGSRR